MGKFKDSWDEHAYSIALDVEVGGDQGSPFGTFMAFDLQHDDDGPGIIEHYGSRHLIVHESSEGFVTVLPFATADLRDRRMLDLTQAFDLWDADVTDDQIKEAIDNYLQAAVFTMRVADPSLSWSAAAQLQARDEVVQFVTSDIQYIREFQKATGHGWAQVGIDFSLTRNGHGAGFWDRGAGDAGDVLTRSAKAWGEVEVVVNDQGELEFEG